MRRQIFAIDGDNSVAGAQLFCRALRVNPILVKLPILLVTTPTPIAAGRIKPEVKARHEVEHQKGEEGNSENKSKLFGRHNLNINREAARARVRFSIPNPKLHGNI